MLTAVHSETLSLTCGHSNAVTKGGTFSDGWFSLAIGATYPSLRLAFLPAPSTLTDHSGLSALYLSSISGTHVGSWGR